MSYLNSKIIICKGIKQDKAYNNVYDGDMLAVCNATGHYVDRRNSYSFIRDDGSISTDFNYASALQCNYMAFQNPDYDNKWFFAWIDEIEYKGERNIRLHYTIDYWSTWWSTLVKQPVLVEREHVNDDTPFLHTIPEPVTCDSYDEFNYHSRLFVNWKPHLHLYVNNPGHSTGGAVEGYRFGSKYMNPLSVWYFDIDDRGLSSLHAEIERQAGNMEAIVGLTMFPAELTSTGIELNPGQYTPLPDQNVTIQTIDTANDGWGLASRPGEGFSINGYVPVNNKLFTYPYCYIDIDDGHNHIQLRNEFFRDPFTKLEFSLVGYDLTPQMEITLYPKNYHGKTNNSLNALTISDLPQIPIPVDSYKAWLAQKSNSQILSALGSTLTGAVGGAVSGGPIGAVIGAGMGLLGGGVSYVAQSMSAEDASDSIKGNCVAGNNLFMDQIGFSFKQVGLKADAAKSVDNFFSKYGYVVNEVKTPNYTGRQYWNYVKISGNAGYGNMPETAREQLNTILNRGVTIWHNEANMGNYLIGGAKMQNPII